MKLQQKNKVVLITGASGNLGSAVARKYLDIGANVVLLEQGFGKLKTMFPQLPGDPNHLIFEGVDVANPELITQTVKQVKQQLGTIDILVNTVGGYQAGWPLHETSLAVWHKMIAINATSVFVTCQAVIPTMITQKSGSIVNIAGGAGLKGGVKMSAYSAAKSAVIRLTESMAEELKQHEVRVNCILPGTIDTPQNRAAMPKADFSRWVSPDSLADVIAFLGSDSASNINGAAIPVSG